MAVQPKLERLLSQLNNTGLQKESPALFQILSILIKYLMQSQVATGEQIVAASSAAPILGSDLLTHSDETALLANSRELLAGDGITFDDTVANERTVDNSLIGLDYLTHSDESAILTASRRLLAGTGVSFDDTVANQRTINNTATGEDWDVLTDGDVNYPELIFASGEVIMTHTP